MELIWNNFLAINAKIIQNIVLFFVEQWKKISAFSDRKLCQNKIYEKKPNFFQTRKPFFLHCCFARHHRLERTCPCIKLRFGKKKTKIKKTSLTCVSELIQAEVIKTWKEKENILAKKDRLEEEKIRKKEKALLPCVLHSQTHE